MIETKRLILRQWKETDFEPFIKMGLDQDVMQFFPNLLTPQESLNLIQKISSLIDENGWDIPLECLPNHRTQWREQLYDSYYKIGIGRIRKDLQE